MINFCILAFLYICKFSSHSIQFILFCTQPTNRVHARSSLGGEAASTWESSLAVLCVYTIQQNWFPVVGLYSVYIVHCTLYSVYIVQCVRCIN